MGFSVRVAKGVRLRASSRGLGLSMGRRGAYASIGGGRRGVGVSVPVAGSLRYYTTVGGSSGTRRPSLGQYERQVRQAQQLEELQALAAQLEAMLSIHRQVFPPAQPPVASPPESVDYLTMERKHRREQRRGILFYRFSERRAAKRKARALAVEEARREEQAREAARARTQAELDEWWRKLLENDRDVVLGVLEASFADNQAPAVPINCEDGRATIVMLMEREDVVPEHRPHVTPTGRPSSKKLTQTERSELYQAWLSSNLLVTVKEAFAVAPGLQAATVVVLRRVPNPFGELKIDAVYCGTFSRERFNRLNFQSLDVLDAIFHAEDVRMETKGRTKRLMPVDLSKDPEMGELVAEVESTLVDTRRGH
jgi:hypothetical protein